MGITKFVLKEGDRYSLLTLTEKVQVFKDGRKNGWRWMASCQCGKIVGPLVPAHIVKGHVKSCGKCQRVNSWVDKRLTGVENPSKLVYRNYRYKAHKRGLEFYITYEDFMSLVQEPCIYCGRTNTSYFNPVTEYDEKFLYTGIDRVNSSKGYVLGNIQPCCKICNRAKSDMSEELFLNWIEEVFRKSVNHG